ncbi:AAA family ATPase [Nostoc sp.]|uniref:AAA family ATPase n=1 Tax=Nostoc sp. TaxID=1180 RepID=UPI002FFB7F01
MRSSPNSTDFLIRIFQNKLTNQTQRSFVELIRDKLNICQGSDISDDDLWNFLRSMVILHFDFQKEGSRDYTYAIQTVSYLLPHDQKNEAPNVFTKLVEYAAEANISAGAFNSDILTQKLLSDNFALLPSHDCSDDLNRLQEHIDFILRDIRCDVGGFVLDRVKIVNTAREMMKKTSLLLLVGSPGTGKSAILKTLVESHRNEGFTIVIAWDRISGNDWNSFAASLQLTQPLKKLLLAVSGTSHPTIFIDGIDKIIDSGKCKVINDLIRILAEITLSKDGSRRWTVVASIREENLEQLYKNLDWRILGKPEKLPIPELSSEELDSIAEHSPRLKPLLLIHHLKPIISNLFILSLLEDQRMIPNVELLPSIATEIEVSQVWWDNLVGKNSVEGRTRQQSLGNTGLR